jgi:hypothetical protein
MRKLKLDPEQLMVESFATVRMGGEGTVRGAACETAPQTDPSDCGSCDTQCGQWTCDQSCNGTCGGWSCDESCAGTCYYDVTCNSCNITLCPTGASPECCV